MSTLRPRRKWQDQEWTTYEATHKPESFIAAETDTEELKARIYAPKGAKYDHPLPDMDEYRSSPGNLSIISREENEKALWRCLYLKKHKLSKEVTDTVGNAPVVFPNNQALRPKTSWVLAITALWTLMAKAFKKAELLNVRFVFTHENGAHFLHLACDQNDIKTKKHVFNNVTTTPLGDDSIRFRLHNELTGRSLFKLAGHIGDALITWKASSDPELQLASLNALTGLMMTQLD